MSALYGLASTGIIHDPTGCYAEIERTLRSVSKKSDEQELRWLRDEIERLVTEEISATIERLVALRLGRTADWETRADLRNRIAKALR